MRGNAVFPLIYWCTAASRFAIVLADSILLLALKLISLVKKLQYIVKLITFPLNSMTKAGHIYLIDDDESMRTSLSRMMKEVGYIVEDFSSAEAFLENSLPVAPAVILLDMQMPDMTGLDLQEKLLQLGRKTPIVFVSGQSHPHQIVKGLKQGDIDFLFKPFNLEDLLGAVADALEFDGRQLKRISKEVETKKDYASLTPREKEVCFWLVKGLLNKDIAIKLGTTDATIKVHKARVMEKMKVESLQTLVAKYLGSNLDNMQNN